MSDAVEVQQRKGRACIRLRVKPGARHSRLQGAHGGALKIEIGAPPERGRANTAVMQLIASVLGVAMADVEIAGGAHSRDKTVAFVGATAAEIAARLIRAGVPARVE